MPVALKRMVTCRRVLKVIIFVSGRVLSYFATTQMRIPYRVPHHTTHRIADSPSRAPETLTGGVPARGVHELTRASGRAKPRAGPVPLKLPHRRLGGTSPHFTAAPGRWWWWLVTQYNVPKCHTVGGEGVSHASDTPVLTLPALTSIL